MSAPARWAVVVLVLAVAGAVALWPRSSDPVDQAAIPTRTQRTVDLDAVRGQAALRPCPQGPPDAQGPAALRGVIATCLADGNPVDVASTVTGRAVVNFWATWCVPCQEELRVLDTYAREPGAVPVVAVLVESKEADGLELLAKLGVHLPSVFDPADGVRKAARAPRTLPLSYVVGADGSLTQVTDPVAFTSVEQVREVVG
ncbi:MULTISPECIES: TlpA family protein disulfide reductase [Saccharothrix]|uniref:TlpA family protein disulfide reductase n=1 Tax=Saccharothrix TaxID=2071 RepID=UPI00093AD347|nr:TlpA disulfide reductase family protein [Saccharothrix sp. CB00851]OKI37140.1 alkyl hydroperoxide reductase [Saccharothrix sp. CB00851]